MVRTRVSFRDRVGHADNTTTLTKVRHQEETLMREVECSAVSSIKHWVSVLHPAERIASGLNKEQTRMVRVTKFAAIGAACALVLTLAAAPVSAATIYWTTWTSGTVSSTAGSASGTIAGLGLSVAYTGEMGGLDSWTWLPATSYSGGTVSNPPPTVPMDLIHLVGGGQVIDTITFSAPVVNPILAIWSLGQGGNTARFTFTPAEPFTIQGGGPGVNFGGSSIFAGGSCPANSVCGTEGNGVVQLNGTFSSITWINPVAESFYGFTVGVTNRADLTAVPEPASMTLLGTGLLALARRRFARRA